MFTQRSTSNQLFERIALVTNAVYGCIYCSWLDGQLAASRGMSDDEIRDMLTLQFRTTASQAEPTALLFAQHFAETNRHPDPAMTKKLVDEYGTHTANDILIAIRASTFGNLYFNTFGAAVSRLKGTPAPNSNALFETIYFLLNLPIVAAFTVLKRLDKGARQS